MNSGYWKIVIPAGTNFDRAFMEKNLEWVTDDPLQMNLPEAKDRIAIQLAAALDLRAVNRQDQRAALHDWAYKLFSSLMTKSVRKTMETNAVNFYIVRTKPGSFIFLAEVNHVS